MELKQHVFVLFQTKKCEWREFGIILFFIFAAGIRT